MNGPMPVIEAHDGLSRDCRECLGVVAEVAQVLNPWQESVCLIGGWAVYALTEMWLQGREHPPLHHRGSLDVDIALAWPDITARQADEVFKALLAAGYESTGSFRLTRQTAGLQPYSLDLMVVPPPGHSSGSVTAGGHQFGPFWNGEAALRSPQPMLIRAVLPAGNMAEVPLHVATPAGLLLAKVQTAFVPGQQPTEKHIYDAFVMARTFRGGPAALAEHCRAVLLQDELETLSASLEALFAERSFGPRLVASERISAEGGDLEDYMTEAEVTMSRFLRQLRGESI